MVKKKKKSKRGDDDAMEDDAPAVAPVVADTEEGTLLLNLYVCI